MVVFIFFCIAIVVSLFTAALCTVFVLPYTGEIKIFNIRIHCYPGYLELEH